MYPIFTLLMICPQYPDEHPIISIPINLVMMNEHWHSFFLFQADVFSIENFLWVDPPWCLTQDDAMGNLSSAAKDALKTCGATLIDSISYRGSYALIGHMEDAFEMGAS